MMHRIVLSGLVGLYMTQKFMEFMQVPEEGLEEEEEVGSTQGSDNQSGVPHAFVSEKTVNVKALLEIHRLQEELATARARELELTLKMEQICHDLMEGVSQRSAELGCYGVRVAARNEKNRKVLRDIYMDYIIHTMDSEFNNREVLVEGMGALCNLSADKSNQESLIESLDFILHVMKARRQDTELQTFANGLLWNLAIGNALNQQRLLKARAAKFVIKGLQIHFKDENVAEKACGALWCIFHQINDTNRTPWHRDLVHARRAVLESLRRHPQNHIIISSACAIGCFTSKPESPTCTASIWPQENEPESSLLKQIEL